MNGNVTQLDGLKAPLFIPIQWQINYTCHSGFNLNLKTVNIVTCGYGGTLSPSMPPICSGLFYVAMLIRRSVRLVKKDYFTNKYF